MNEFLIALQFITRIPVNKTLNYHDKAIAKSMTYFPIIGTILGIILVGVDYLGELYLGPMANNALLVVLLVILTGGIHLDGFMDTCDGIFSGRDKDRILEIMKDSRVGAFGVIGLVSLFLLKFTLLMEISISYKSYILIYFPTISRWAVVYAAYEYPYARKDGLGKAYGQYVDKKVFAVATACALLIGGFLFQIKGIVGILLIYFFVRLIAKIIIDKIDGLTGDNYGAINEVIEVVAILVMSILRS